MAGQDGATGAHIHGVKLAFCQRRFDRCGEEELMMVVHNDGRRLASYSERAPRHQSGLVVEIQQLEPQMIVIA